MIFIKKLTPKQKKFIDNYTDPTSETFSNATKSAIEAGYSEKTAYSIANENLKKPDIVSAIEAKKADLREQFAEFAQTAFLNIQNIANDTKVSPRTRLDANKDLLDRAGYKPSDKVEGDINITNETRVTKEIAMRARQLLQVESTDEAVS